MPLYVALLVVAAKENNFASSTLALTTSVVGAFFQQKNPVAPNYDFDEPSLVLRVKPPHTAESISTGMSLTP